MRSNPLLLLSVLAIFGLAGCGEDDLTSVESSSDLEIDEQAINTLMSDESDYFGTFESISDERVEVGAATGERQSASGAPIESFYFVRRITERDIYREIRIENPQGLPAQASVETVVDLRGTFYLFYDDPDNIYLPGVIEKPLDATATHRAVFVRRLDRQRPHRGWRVVEMSGVEILSNPTTKDLRSLEISSDSVNLTITDPLELTSIRELPTFLPGERVTLRVTTGDETDFVFLHTGILKDEFVPVGGGVFEGAWNVGERRGARRFAVDVIDADTLFDDEAAYDSAAWVFHYRVAGEPREEFEDS